MGQKLSPEIEFNHNLLTKNKKNEFKIYAAIKHLINLTVYQNTG
ncbi:hypothetical protein yaldo0001_13040 [Yersinia aldovae ATCC 35236]|nr:hypothetical protein yaldo0001_13040 [Yersinia aldovae ATCC 35236]CNJ56398.1 Uncharacterised protein [Yersinia aldovae]